jgi:hypothetical protein
MNILLFIIFYFGYLFPLFNYQRLYHRALLYKYTKVLFYFVGRQFHNLENPVGTFSQLLTGKHFTVFSVVFVWEYYLHNNEYHYPDVKYVCSAACRHSSDTTLQVDSNVK